MWVKDVNNFQIAKNWPQSVAQHFCVANESVGYIKKRVFTQV